MKGFNINLAKLLSTSLGISTIPLVAIETPQKLSIFVEMIEGINFWFHLLNNVATRAYVCFRLAEIQRSFDIATLKMSLFHILFYLRNMFIQNVDSEVLFVLCLLHCRSRNNLCTVSYIFTFCVC